MAHLGPNAQRSGDIASALGVKITSLGPVRAKLIKRDDLQPHPRRHGLYRSPVRRVHAAGDTGV